MEILSHEKQIHEYVKAIEHLKKQSQDNPLFRNEIRKLEQKLDQLKEKAYSELTPWQRVMISRHHSRPHFLDYIANICTDFHELSGDRLFSNDNSLIGGLGIINGMRCVIIGQEKGHDTESRIKHNFGMMNPEGYRKALRLMQLAEKFRLPIVSFVDTPGAYAGLESEERGQGWAIAQNLREMASIATPMIVIVIGEGFSGGALGIAMGDVVAMLEHACYSVITPEGCAAILWKDASKKEEAAAALRLTSEDLLKNGIIDAIIKEPLGGAHHHPQVVYDNVKQYVIEQWRILKKIPADVLLEQRYLKFRNIGRWKIN